MDFWNFYREVLILSTSLRVKCTKDYDTPISLGCVAA